MSPAGPIVVGSRPGRARAAPPAACGGPWRGKPEDRHDVFGQGPRYHRIAPVNPRKASGHNLAKGDKRDSTGQDGGTRPVLQCSRPSLTRYYGQKGGQGARWSRRLPAPAVVLHHRSPAGNHRSPRAYAYSQGAGLGALPGRDGLPQEGGQRRGQFLRSFQRGQVPEPRSGPRPSADNVGRPFASPPNVPRLRAGRLHHPASGNALRRPGGNAGADGLGHRRRRGWPKEPARLAQRNRAGGGGVAQRKESHAGANGSDACAAVAVIGAGIMGAAMARNLVAAGLNTRVWDRSHRLPARWPRRVR